MKEQTVTIISLETAKEWLNKKGEGVKTKKTLFNPGGIKRFTLKEALDHASCGKRTSKYNITEDMYPEIISLYLRYNSAIKRDGICKIINTKFFNHEDSNRFAMQEFTDRLKEYGWDLESPHKRKFSKKKAEMKAAYEATLPKDRR